MSKFFSLVSVLAFAGTAAAQPDPQPTPEPAPPTPAEPPAPVVAPVPPEKTPEPPPVTPTKPPDKKPEPPPTKKLIVGKEGQGRWNPGMLAQGWFQLERAGDTTQVSQFRIRRAEFSLNGEILPEKVSYKVMLDAARVLDTQTKVALLDSMGNPIVDANGKAVTINNAARLSALQDFYITALTRWAEVSIGQFKIPVSWEGYNSSGKIVFPERAIVSNTFGDKRDIGVRITKSFDKWMYSGGVFNGAGQNNADGNAQKDVSLRLEAYPVKGLTIAGVTYDSVGQREKAGTKDRWEGDLRYEHGPVLVQGEMIFAKDVAADGADAIKGHGFYLLAGFSIPDVDKTFHGVLQPVIRVGTFDPNSDVDDNELLHFDVGLNYYLVKHEMKLQLAYQRTAFKDDTKAANNELIFGAQVNY